MKYSLKSYNFIDFCFFFDIIDNGTFIYPTCVSPGKTYECKGKEN